MTSVFDSVIIHTSALVFSVRLEKLLIKLTSKFQCLKMQIIRPIVGVQDTVSMLYLTFADCKLLTESIHRVTITIIECYSG